MNKPPDPAVRLDLNIHGVLKGKVNGARLSIGQINDAIAEAGLAHTCASAAFRCPPDAIDHVDQPDRD